MENIYELLYMVHMGNEKALAEILADYAPVIEYQAKQCIQHYDTYYVYYEELIEEGYLALQQAVWSFREDKDVTFYTYASVLIKRHMWNALRGHNMHNAYEPHNLSYYDAYNAGENTDNWIICEDSSRDPAYQCRYAEAGERLEEVIEHLTDYEKVIYEGLLNGETRKMIVKRLGCSRKAYDGRLRRMRKKAQQAVYS